MANKLSIYYIKCPFWPRNLMSGTCLTGPARSKVRPNISIHPVPNVVELSSDSESEAADLPPKRQKIEPPRIDWSEQNNNGRKVEQDSERLQRDLVISSTVILM